MNHFHIVDVQFSGKPAIYSYVIHPDDDVQVGWRVVVPTGVKDDGSLSLSIVTVVKRHEVQTLADNVKPIVMSIDPVYTNFAKSELLRIAALEAKA